jgi:hypothetical protein
MRLHPFSSSHIIIPMSTGINKENVGATANPPKAYYDPEMNARNDWVLYRCV